MAMHGYPCGLRMGAPRATSCFVWQSGCRGSGGLLLPPCGQQWRAVKHAFGEQRGSSKRAAEHAEGEQLCAKGGEQPRSAGCEPLQASGQWPRNA
ncbi:hypothetical protein Dimus_008086 [Dionaea muscipula]